MLITAINSNIPIAPSLSKTTRPNEKKALKPTITKKSYDLGEESISHFIS